MVSTIAPAPNIINLKRCHKHLVQIEINLFTVLLEQCIRCIFQQLLIRRVIPLHLIQALTQYGIIRTKLCQRLFKAFLVQNKPVIRFLHFCSIANAGTQILNPLHVCSHIIVHDPYSFIHHAQSLHEVCQRFGIHSAHRVGRLGFNGLLQGNIFYIQLLSVNVQVR